MADKSVLDIIYEMHESLLKMQAKLDTLESTNVLLTELLAKQNQGNLPIIKGKPVILSQNTEVAPTVSAPSVAPVPPAAPSITPPVTIASDKEQNTKAFGVLKSHDGKTMHGIPVAIVDAKTNMVIKTTKTNRSGEFMSFLPSGKYIAIATLEDNRQKFKQFEVNKGIKEVEVSII